MKLRAACDTLGELALIYTALVGSSALAFAAVEGVDFVDALYWAGTTATSTGYGDVVAHTPATKLLALMLQHISILLIIPMIVVRLIENMIDNRDAFTHEEQVQILADLAEIKEKLQ